MQAEFLDKLYQAGEPQGGYFTTGQALEADVSLRLLSAGMRAGVRSKIGDRRAGFKLKHP